MWIKLPRRQQKWDKGYWTNNTDVTMRYIYIYILWMPELMTRLSQWALDPGLGVTLWSADSMAYRYAQQTKSSTFEAASAFYLRFSVPLLQLNFWTTLQRIYESLDFWICKEHSVTIITRLPTRNKKSQIDKLERSSRGHTHTWGWRTIDFLNWLNVSQ